MARWDEYGRAPDGTYPSQLSGEAAKEQSRINRALMEENERVLAFIRTRLRQRKDGQEPYDKTARSFFGEFDALVLAHSRLPSGPSQTSEKSVAETLASTFISYGGPDVAFAEELELALVRAGVATFLFAKHGVPGEPLSVMMRRGISQFDKVILVCSRTH